MARNLPQDSKTPIYQDFDGKQIEGIPFEVVSDDNVTPISIWGTRGKRPYANGYLYPIWSKTDKDGNVLPKGVYYRTLWYHRKWARKDKEVTKVTFDIIGLKRASTHLPAGVIISGIKYICE